MSQHPEPLIINLTPTGMMPTKKMTPHVPITCDEILADVRACAAIGASIVHVHARNEQGIPTHDRECFAPIIEGIRQIDPDLVVCVTCSGRHVAELEKRADVLSLTGAAKPDMASLTLGSNNFIQQASVNAPDVICSLAELMKKHDIKPELEAFEPGMVDFGKHLVRQGLIEEPCYVNILLGNLGTSPLGPGSLGAFLSLIPDTWTWAVGGIGRFQFDANALAIAAGGHVRVGLEDNIYFDRDRKDLATNARLVERIVRLAELSQRPLATPRSVREKLGLARR